MQHAEVTARMGCYLLPGAGGDPRTALDEASAAADLGLGTVWIAERYDVKDLPSIAGAVAATQPGLAVGAAVTHFGMRHPLVLASMGQTLQALTGGRFRLGFGRSVPERWHEYGVPTPSLEETEQVVDVLRRLWAGEVVASTGITPRPSRLRLGQVTTAPPVLLAAVGPKALDTAGRTFDGVLLHPFLTINGVRRSAAAARAASTGERPFKVVAVVVVAPDDGAPPEEALGRRASRYFRAPALRRSLAEANDWDLDPTGTDAPDPALLAEAAAWGEPARCAQVLRDHLDVGVDELILHGATAPRLRDVIDALRQV